MIDTHQWALWQVQLPHATFDITTDEYGKVTAAPPIGRWMVGRLLDDVLLWVELKNGILEFICPGT